jgi:RecA/RadA recombinase
MSTDAEILTAIDAAIIDVLENGQVVMFKGVSYNKANITDLFTFREKYSQKVSVSTDTFFSRSKTIVPRRQ